MKRVWHTHTPSRLPGVRTRPWWEASLLLCNRAKLTCGLICVHGKKRKANLCKKTQQICIWGQYKVLQQYLSIVWSEFIKPDARPSQRTISWLNFVFLHWLLGPWTAFFSDFRRPWFPCGSSGGTTWLPPPTARPAGGPGSTLQPHCFQKPSCRVFSLKMIFFNKSYLKKTPGWFIMS